MNQGRCEILSRTCTDIFLTWSSSSSGSSSVVQPVRGFNCPSPEQQSLLVKLLEGAVVWITTLLRLPLLRFGGHSYLRRKSRARWTLHRLWHPAWLTVVGSPLTDDDTGDFQLATSRWDGSTHEAALRPADHRPAAWIAHKTIRDQATTRGYRLGLRRYSDTCKKIKHGLY